MGGSWTEQDHAAEYWPEHLGSGPTAVMVPSVLPRPAAISAWLLSLPTRAQRDAIRALRGQVVRSEVYALDATTGGAQDRPYVVVERLSGLREEAPPTANAPERPRIFFAYPLAERSTLWERGSDPRSTFTFTDEYDAFGQPRDRASVAVPRGRQYWDVLPAGAATPEPYLAEHSLTDYAHPIDAAVYIEDRVARITSYAVEADGHDDLPSLRAKLQGGTLDQTSNLTGQAVTYYDGPAFTGLPFAQVGTHGAVARSETLVLTDAQLGGGLQRRRQPGAAAWHAGVVQRGRADHVAGRVSRVTGVDHWRSDGRSDATRPGHDGRWLRHQLRRRRNRARSVQRDGPPALRRPGLVNPAPARPAARAARRIGQRLDRQLRPVRFPADRRDRCARSQQVPAYRVEWQAAAGSDLGARAAALLDARLYESAHAYDALNRVVLIRCPTDASGARQELRPAYNKSGALEHVTLDQTVYVDHIAYNARGQRTFIAHGNGVLSRYVHDGRTFRLVRLRSESYVAPAAGQYHP